MTANDERPARNVRNVGPGPDTVPRQRVLVCDDEKLIRDMLQKSLVARGYEVLTAADGQEAVEQVIAARPALLLLDLMMPRMDGFDVLRVLRSRPEHLGLQIIVLTARASQEVLQEALEAGADDYVSKPFHLGEVMSRVEAHLRIAAYAEALDRKRQDSHMLVDISQRLTGRLDMQEILNEVAQRVAHVLDSDRCSVVLLEPEGRQGRVVAASDSTGLMDRRISLDGYPEIGRVLETREPLVVADIGADPLFDPVKDQLAQLDVRSVALFPLFAGTQLIGVLFLRSKTPLEHFGDRELAFGQIVANATAVAVANARVFTEIKEETDRLSHARDIVEQRLRVVERYQDFFESSADAMFVTEAYGSILFMNRQAEQLTGLSRVLAAGLPFADLASAGDRLRAATLLERARQGETVGREDFQLSGPRPLTVSISVGRLPGEGQTFCLTVRDVTQERAVAKELARTKDFLHNLIDASGDAVVAVDLEGRVVLFNKRAEALFELTASEVVGQTHLSALLPEGGAAELGALLASDEEGGAGRIVPAIERTVLGRDGTPIPVLLAGSRIEIEGEDMGLVLLLQDQRDRIRMRNQLHQAQEKLIQSERQAVLAELAGTAAHELNQPLTSVMGYAELLRKRLPEADPNAKAAETIHREASRMAEIVKRIGRITRYETKQYVGNARIIDLAAAAPGDSQERGPQGDSTP
jgi:PAS domain S-box-containing protein